MLITASQYPQFSDTTLESLTLSLAKKILEVQKSPSLNLTNDTIITITENLTDEVCNVTLTGLQGVIVDGVITVKNYFAFNFTDGIGEYPYDRTNLVDAFFHVLMYHQKHELMIAKNPGSKQCLDYDLTNVTEMNQTQPLIINCSLTDYPINVNNLNSSTSAKQYLI
jgi:hypothetical protein